MKPSICRPFSQILLLLAFLSINPSYSYPLNAPESSGLYQWGYIVSDTIDLSGNSYYGTKTLSGYSILAVTGFKITADGTLSAKGLSCVRKLRGMNMIATEMIPVITFSTVESGIRLLRSDILRRTSINNIISLVVQNSFKSIHFDFEYLPPLYSAHLEAFLKELRTYIARSAIELKVTMAIFPQVEFPEKWSRFHDLKRVSPFLDEIVLMCYDYHRPDTSPGPVVDMGWAGKNISYALRYMRPEQIWLGIPAYGYMWSGSDRAYVISARSSLKLSADWTRYRHISGTMRYEHNSKTGRSTAFIADAETRGKLHDLAQRHGLRGTALWRIGFEEIQ